MNMAQFAAVLAPTWVFATSASAQAPAAIVEDVSGNPPGIGFMDYVEAGRIIRLAPGNSIVLSYLKSCIREVIRSGVITVGVDQSEVQDAKLERGKVDCDAGKMLAAPRQANDIAGWVSKDLQLEPMQATPVPEFTLYGLSPIFEVSGDGTLAVQRLDRADNRIVLTIFRKQLVREAFLDFSAVGLSLAAGGIYVAAWGDHRVVFKIDPGARAGRTPIIGRWLRLEPTN